MVSVSLDYSTKDNRWKSIPHPPGFTHSQTHSSARSSKDIAASHASLKQKRAWELAISPAKSLPMQAFMLYMSGGGVQIFSMGIVAMLLFSPFKALLNMNAAFAPFASKSSKTKTFWTLLPQKLAYILCNALTVALGLWKCNSMGLLPTGTADWLAFETRGPSPEISLF